MFKRIFGHIGNEDITASLIGSIIEKKITNVELDNNTILEKDLFDDKVGILDIRAKIDNNINCNIEMQVVDHSNIEKRILFYWSKIYSKSINAGKDYSELEKTIVILISDYELESLKEVSKYQTKWQIREEEYHRIILTDVMELYISKLEKDIKNKLKEKNYTVSKIKIEINENEEYSIKQINLLVQKDEEETEKKQENAIEIENIETINIQVNENIIPEQKEENISVNEISKIKQYLASEYQINEKQININ